MKVLLRRPRATATTGAIGVSGGEDEYLGGDDGSEKREWGVSVERGVYDEPIIKRWEDLKVCMHVCMHLLLEILIVDPLQ